jgi:hypothetical protein
MAVSHHFQVGDRVRTIHKYGNLPKGSSGTMLYYPLSCQIYRSTTRPDRNRDHGLSMGAVATDSAPDAS